MSVYFRELTKSVTFISKQVILHDEILEEGKGEAKGFTRHSVEIPMAKRQQN